MINRHLTCGNFKSKNALRVQKNKNKKSCIGIKQLNVELPVEYRNSMKILAKSLTDKKTIKVESVKDLFNIVELEQDNVNALKIGIKYYSVIQNGGLKSKLLKYLLN